MKVLVLNSGSSSIKYQLINMENQRVLAKGLVERIGIEGSVLKHRPAGKDKVIIEGDISDHEIGIKMVIDALLDDNHGVIANMEEISAVGHRIVHGGEEFSESALLTEEVIQAIENWSELAPLHNPPNLLGVKATEHLLPDVPNVGVFDTAFHQNMPKHAYMYGVPYKYYKKYHVRRYGFHGTSHQYVAQRAAELMDKNLEDLKIITCHLGNGSSLAAIKNGRSIDTSLGFGTMCGVMMGTRAGDIDPAIIPFLMDKEDMDTDDIQKLLYKESGLLGISGTTNDMRDVEDAAEEGDERADLAIDMFCYHIKKYIGAYAAALGGLDAIVFTAGIGENGPIERERVCNGLEFLGAKLHPELNKHKGKEGFEGEISTEDSEIKIFLIPTNEELMIAQETVRIVNG
jgi:acetate kinase